MKGVLVLAVALILETGCGGRIAEPRKNETLKQGTGMPLTIASPEVVQTDTAAGVKQSKETPHAFRKIDFNNLSYPMSWKNERISLKDGKREYYQHRNLGNSWFDLEDVYYVDMTGDEQEEAVVVIHAVLCSVSCDGGSHLFYFFSIDKNRLKLLWRFETGSPGYGCGLKYFHLAERRITLEVFNTCSFRGATLEPRDDSEQIGGKFQAESVTRFAFKFQGRKHLRRKSEVLTIRQEDIRNYRPKIVITND